MPDRPGLRVDHDERGRGAGGRVARRPPAPLPDAHGAGGRGGRGARAALAGRAAESDADAARRAGAHAGGLDLLWAHYASPLYQGAMDLWTDARSDDELRDVLI